MALPGELKGLGTVICEDCGSEMPIRVCISGAGPYLGHTCPQCGPYSRETGYYASMAEARRNLQIAKAGGTPAKLRKVIYMGGW